MRNLGKRDEEVLSSLVAAFIDTGRPVGSASVAKDLGERFSSATIRNVMAELEGCGLLKHLHTSGGRVPTGSGLRYYVDKLLRVPPVTEKEMRNIEEDYKNASYSLSGIFQKTSRLLSRLSNYAGLVVAPEIDDMVIKHMEFIFLSKNRMLGIFVGCDGLVENRIIKVGGEYNHSELEKINNYCNRAFYGLTLSAAREKVAKDINLVKEEYDRLICRALLLSQMMFFDMEKVRLFVEGGTQLLHNHDFGDSGKAASLVDALEEKKGLINLLNVALESERVNIFIGSESDYSAISGCSVVARSYKKDGNILGTLGVIGPVRMNYAKVVPIVDCTARLIGEFLGENAYDR